MNTFSHRLIFNRERGCLMAVAESAKAGGKSGGESRSCRGRGQNRSCKRSLNFQQMTRLQGASCFDRRLAVPASHIPLGLARIAPSQLGSGDEALRYASATRIKRKAGICLSAF